MLIYGLYAYQTQKICLDRLRKTEATIGYVNNKKIFKQDFCQVLSKLRILKTLILIKFKIKKQKFN